MNVKKRTLLLTAGAVASLVALQKKKLAQSAIVLNGDYPELKKVQHAVFYVKDLEESQAFYKAIFDLQYSATNHPDSSAAMKVVGHTMKFFSFGHYHHDVCFVQNPKVVFDNEQWSHYSIKLANGVSLDKIKERLATQLTPFYEGRVLPQLVEREEEVIHFKDPNGHIIEVVA
jgi:catechol 2,3-dioxygenase-like lactoylglutathione lyase family enzyme